MRGSCIHVKRNYSDYMISFACYVIVYMLLSLVAVAVAVTSSPVRTARQPIDHKVDLPTQRPLVIAHRGSSGTLPEHTMQAYRRAIAEGADVIECDVTLSQDLVPVCLHENLLDITTDVDERSEFVAKRKNRTLANLDGSQETRYGWFAIDFTLDELKSLRKKQSKPFRDQSFNHQLQIATLDEYITLAKQSGRPVGIYPELKDPEWINSQDVVIASSRRFEDIFLEVLRRHNYSSRRDACFIQSFSESSLTYLASRTDLPLVLLIEDTPANNSELERWSQTFYGLGLWINVVAEHWTTDNGYKNWIHHNATGLIARIHSYGLMVHIWTIRNEDQFLAWDFAQDINRALDFYVNLGVDGMFTDFPLTVVRHFNHIQQP